MSNAGGQEGSELAAFAPHFRKIIAAQQRADVVMDDVLRLGRVIVQEMPCTGDQRAAINLA